MRAILLAAILLVVFAASALNLLLGGIWAAALVVVSLLRLRFRYAAWLVLVLTVGAGVAAVRLSWLVPPPSASYEADEVAWLRQRLALLGRLTSPRLGTTGATYERAAAAVRARLATRRLEEFRQTGRQLEQRAVAAIAVSREIGRLRSRAPAEVKAVEEAVRQLALTLTAPEFRDLDAREARLAEYFAALEARLAAAQDQADLDAVTHALEPAATAAVSFRALREDLVRVETASAALVRTLTGGGGVAASATSRVEYDEARGRLIYERRVVFDATPPLRLTRLDVSALRRAATGRGVVQTLAYGADGAPPRTLAGGAEIPLGSGASGAMRVLVVDRRERGVTPVPIGSPLRPIRFSRLTIPGEPGPPAEFPVRVALGGAAGPEPLLVVEAAPAPLEGVTLPRYAFYYASLAGAVATREAADLWVPAEPERVASAPAELGVEMMPAQVLLRNAAFARLRPWIYTPNPATALGCVGLAALASVVVRPRPRRRRPPGPVSGVR
ncbi:MAG: hypothetical protein HY002_19130 [Candidatus Rokubacteria bacterium]|nr:hypothetical protein [Candidatus Rokubacteria bacterium]